MARMKIKDLPKDMKISKEEMKRILGGNLLSDAIFNEDSCPENSLTYRITLINKLASITWLRGREDLQPRDEPIPVYIKK